MKRPGATVSVNLADLASVAASGVLQCGSCHSVIGNLTCAICRQPIYAGEKVACEKGDEHRRTTKHPLVRVVLRGSRHTHPRCIRYESVSAGEWET